MRSHRKLLILILILVVTAAAAIVAYQRIARPANAVLLLPDGDLLLYVNFTPAHFFDLGRLPVHPDPEYQDFLQQTNFHFEHDLDTVAVSVRNPGDSNSDVAAILVGTFDQAKISAYLQKMSAGTESYADKTIFLGHEKDRNVRACFLDAKTIAVTSMESPEPMHTLIDRSRGFHVVAKSPSLVQDYYSHVPFASLAWAMIRVPSQVSDGRLSGGMDMDFLRNAVLVVSVRYTGSIRLKADIISANDSDAAKVLQAVNTFLALGKGAMQSLSPGGPDKDVKAVFDSIQVQQTGKETVLTVTIPQEFVKKMSEKMNQ